MSRGREALRDLLLLPFVMLAVLLMLLALPVILPLASALAKRDRRRLCEAAEATPCGRCGQPLGLVAVELAEADRDASLEGMMEQGLRPRVVRRVLARCPSCGAGHGWDEHQPVLHLLPAELWDVSTPQP